MTVYPVENQYGGKSNVAHIAVRAELLSAMNIIENPAEVSLTVETGSGTAAISVSEEVSGIEYANGSQYLVLKDTGRLVAISSITAIN